MESYLSLDEQRKLAQAACKGDEGAARKIILAYREALFGYIRVRSTQDADAEDISQDFWQQIFTGGGICRYDPSRAALYTFFKIIAHSRLIDFYRKRGKDNWVQIIEDEVSGVEEVEGGGAEGIRSHIDSSLVVDPKVGEEDDLSSAYKSALGILFANGGYPHQVIVYAFGKLVDHWKPRKIIEKLSDVLLRQLYSRLHEDYLIESKLPDKEIAPCFSRLEQKMDLLVDKVISDPSLRDKLKPLLNRKVGDTTLRDYYGKDASHSISDWCDKVNKRLERGREEIIG